MLAPQNAAVSSCSVRCPSAILKPPRARDTTKLRQRKNIQHSALGRFLRQVFHRIHKTESARGIARVEIARDDRPRPTAYARQHSNVLFTVRSFVGHRLPDDP